jgi:hypothetical protein
MLLVIPLIDFRLIGLFGFTFCDPLMFALRDLPSVRLMQNILLNILRRARGAGKMVQTHRSSIQNTSFSFVAASLKSSSKPAPAHL